MKNKILITSVLIYYSALNSFAQNWQSLGPKNLPKGYINDADGAYCAHAAGNGAFFTIAAEPDNYQNIYASGNNSGIRRSLSGYTQWDAPNTGFTEVSTADKIVIDRQKRNGHFSMYACNQWGLFRSDDQGNNWNATSFNPVIDPANYNHPFFPTYDADVHRYKRITEFDIAPDLSSASQSEVLANVKWAKYGEENHLILYDFGTAKYKDLTSEYISNYGGQNTTAVNFQYSDIISFPDNANLQNKKFYIKVDKYDTYWDAGNNIFRPVTNGGGPIIISSTIYTLEITTSNVAPYFTTAWTDISANIYGQNHPLPGSSSLIYADIEVMKSPLCSNYVFAYVNGKNNLMIEQNQMVMSSDNGAHWQKCNGDYYGLTKYAVSEKLNNNNQPQFIYYFWRDGNDGQAYKTEIAGQATNITVLSYFSSSSPLDYCMYNTSQQRITGQFHPDQRAIEVVGDNNNEAIYIADDGGVAVSYNEGSTFGYLHNNEGLNAAHINGIATSADGDFVASGFHHSGSNVYGLLQNDWINFFGGDGGEMLIDSKNKNRIFFQATGSETPVYEMNLQDGSRRSIFGNLVPTSWESDVRPMQFFTNDDQLYCGYKELTVAKKSNGAWAPKQISNLGSGFIKDFYVSPDKTKMYYVAGGPTWNASALGLFRNFSASGYNTATGLLINGNGYWEDITSKFHLPGNGGTYSQYNQIGGMVVDPVDYNTLYIALNEYSTSNDGRARPYRVFKSVNGGDSWESISTGLPEYAIKKIIFDKATQTLYIGTSGGVYSYVDAGSSSWQEFNPTNPSLGKLPKCLIIDLEINQKTRKLYAGAEGYGVWVTDLPCLNTVGVNQITQDEIWGELSTSNEIEVLTGHTLTIAGNLYCTSNVKITVFPGAKLIIDGAKISNIGTCSMVNWLGIILLGDQYHPQNPTYQGIVELKNGAIIENAINGISVGDYNNGALNGGIIKANNATFLNCIRDVEFLWYTYAKITSYFKNCTFKCTQILPNNNGYGTGDYVTLSGIQGVSFSGCTWECAMTAMSPPTNDNRGRGVFGIDFTASFENTDDAFLTINPTCSLSAGNKCVFKNLTKGIEFERDNQDYHIYVRGCTFENVGIGIDMYGSHTTSQAPKGCVIWGNEFKWNASCIGGMPTGGVYVGVRTGLGGNLKFDNFYIDNNTFTIDPLLPPNTGINIICTDISNSGNYYRSEVFENFCTNGNTTNLYHTAVRIQSFNAKLELQCGNHYSGFDHDWKLTGGTANFSLKDQGVTTSNYSCTNLFTAGKPANIYVINVTPPMANNYYRKTASAYDVTTNSTTYLSPNSTLFACTPSDPCNLGGYVITDGGGNGEGLGFAPNMKPKMDWKNKNELYNGSRNDFYSLDNSNQIKIRPNPASDQMDVLYNLNIDDGSMGEISIINSDGKLVKKESVYALASVKTIDISNLANGIYQVVLNQNGKIIASNKLVIVH